MTDAGAHPGHERGIVLVNVLCVLAISSAVMMALLALQDASIERATQYSDAATATSYALGGETSAVVALRRDAREAGQTDSYAEPWGKLGETGVAIEGGGYKQSIIDEQSRYNLNNLLVDGLAARAAVDALLKQVGAPPAYGALIQKAVLSTGGLSDIADLETVGLDRETIFALADMACALPEPTDVNINTASEPLLAALFGNRATAQLLVGRRTRQGFLTPVDITAARTILPGRMSFRSDYFVVSTTVTYGVAAITIESRIHRLVNNGQPAVVVWDRKRNPAAGGASRRVSS